MKSLGKLRELRTEIQDNFRAQETDSKPKVIIGMGTCGIAAGARKIMQTIRDEINKEGIDAVITHTGCIGMCEKEPLVDVKLPGEDRITYGNVSEDDARKIVKEHIINQNIIEDLLIARLPEDDFSVKNKSTKKMENIPTYKDIVFYKKQRRIVLDNCGRIDPNSIEEYIAGNGYEAAGIALTEMEPKEVIEEIKDSGLRGRGGGGFSTGLKWQFAYDEKDDEKYIVCNADEGDPGAFMDRSLLEGDPHRVVEGMIICAYAIGANKGYVYVREEYPLAIERLNEAIEKAREKGLLGENILSSGFDFELQIKKGAGAFVCGEETALMASIEGKRGMPKPRPPFPAQSGLWGHPTNINNVETYANVPYIIREGAQKFAGVGTENSSGTKVFALTGKVKNTGLAEVPMGITMEEVIYDVAGGIADDNQFKAVQIGGPSGGCLPEEKLGLPIDYDSLVEAGAIMGSGGLVVMDEDTCMVDVARFFLDFTQKESCGKCPPCREGTKKMLDILTRITEGEGEEGDISQLKELGEYIQKSSLCGLGQTAPNPVLSTLEYFEDEYKAHIYDENCPAGVCRKLVGAYKINQDACVGCTKCSQVCSVNAINRKKGAIHEIDPEVCIACGVCAGECPVEAISQK